MGKRDVPLIKMENIHKSFGKIRALKDIEFEVRHAEVVGLVGDNGAGKSTLANILAGVYPPDRGKIYVEGIETKIRSPRNTLSLGIETIYQLTTLIEGMDIKRNVFLARELTKRFGPFQFLDLKRMGEEALQCISKIGLKIRSSDIDIKELSGGQRQAVAIASALYHKQKLLILDEPTNNLSIRESRKILELIVSLKEQGVSSIFITHNLHDVYPVADRICILRRGENCGVWDKEKTTIEEITRVIIQE